MKKLILLLAVLVTAFSCNVTETLIFDENGSGEYFTKYDLSEAMKQIGAMGPEGSADNKDEKNSKVMDTLIVFSDIMEVYKDSVAALPENERLVLESLKGMYMKINANEAEKEMEFGVGLKFKSLEDLKDIQKKIRAAQAMSQKDGELDKMKENPMMSMLFGSDESELAFEYNDKYFTRNTFFELPEDMSLEDVLLSEEDASDESFQQMLSNASYSVKLKFPKKIKSYSIEGAKLSEDGKSLEYTFNWVEYLKNPKVLDVKVEFEDE